MDTERNPFTDIMTYERALSLIEARFTGFGEETGGQPVREWYCPKHAIERFWPAGGRRKGQVGWWQNAFVKVEHPDRDVYSHEGHRVVTTEKPIQCPSCLEGKHVPINA